MKTVIKLLNFLHMKFGFCIFLVQLLSFAWSRPINHIHIDSKRYHIHEKPLYIVYRYFSTSFEWLLPKDKSVATNNQNLQIDIRNF